MPLTDTQYQEQILDEVGDTPDAFLAGARLERCWLMYDDLAAQPRLRYWNVLKKACELLLGHVREMPDFTTQNDLGVKLNQLFTNLMSMIAHAEEEICREQKGIAGRAPVVGRQTTRAATDQPPGLLDANAPGYSGSPYVPPVKVQW